MVSRTKSRRGLLLRPLIFVLAVLLCFTFTFTFGTNTAHAALRRRTLSLSDSYDVVIAGGGCSGVAAAVQAARMGVSVLLVEESAWLGGQATAAGVSTMDDLSRLKSGFYLELYNRIQEIYGARGKSTGTCYWSPKSVAFEPHVGQEVMIELLSKAVERGRNILDVRLNSSISAITTEPTKSNGKNKSAKQVTGVTVRTPSGTFKVACKVLIDATEYGDMIPLANMDYRIGNSRSPFINPEAMIQDITWVAVIKRYASGIPSNLRPLTPLPGYDLAKRNYESYVTPNGANFKGVYPVVTPVNFVSHNAYRGLPDLSTPWSYDGNRENWASISKSCVNWGNDYPGTYGWEGRRGLPALYLDDPMTRLACESAAMLKTLHFIYYMQNELGENWSVADDEYYSQELPPAAKALNLPWEWQEIARRLPPIPYVRESRRIVGDYTLTSAEMLRNSLSCRDGQTNHEFFDAIAIGGYILDLHGANTDSDLEWEFEERSASSEINRPRGPFQVPMRVLVPKNIEGFLAAEKNISVTRLSAGALRLQPISMMTGQAAGALAAIASKTDSRLRDVPAVRVQWELLHSGQNGDTPVVLSLTNYSDVPPEHPCNASVQLSNLYGLVTPNEWPHAPSYNINDLDDPVLAMAVIKGNDKGVFGVGEYISQQEMAAMIDRARKALGFSDIKPQPELELENSGNISVHDSVMALGNGKSGTIITRGTFARALALAFDFPDLETAQVGKARSRVHATFPNSDKNNPAWDAVMSLAPFGVLDVYRGDLAFRFGRPVMRVEAVDMLVRAMIACSLEN